MTSTVGWASTALRLAAVPEGTTGQGYTATNVQKWTPLKKLTKKLATPNSPFTVCTIKLFYETMEPIVQN